MALTRAASPSLARLAAFDAELEAEHPEWRCAPGLPAPDRATLRAVFARHHVWIAEAGRKVKAWVGYRDDGEIRHLVSRFEPADAVHVRALLEHVKGQTGSAWGWVGNPSTRRFLAERCGCEVEGDLVRFVG